jgi:hypothetical protein
MKLSRIAALIGKELREGLRSGWTSIPATALVTVLLLVNAKTRANLTMFLPLLAMPFYASTVLSRAIQTERLRGGLLPLLVYGGSAAEVWLAKVASAFALAYAAMLLSLGGYVGWTGVFPTMPALPHLFITMPIASLSLIALQALLFWVMPRSSLLSVIVPITMMFGGAQLIVMLGLRSVSFTSATLAILGSCAIAALSAVVVDRYPRERTAGLVAA